jgi:PilZ domain-containing protein
MLDRRQSPRDKVLYGGVAEINERGSTMDCVVRNVSEAGACVEFNQAAKLPEEMRLTISRKGRSFLARMIWRQANRVGLAFRTMVTDPPSSDLEERLRISQIKQRQLKRRIKELIGQD